MSDGGGRANSIGQDVRHYDFVGVLIFVPHGGRFNHFVTTPGVLDLQADIVVSFVQPVLVEDKGESSRYMGGRPYYAVVQEKHHFIHLAVSSSFYSTVEHRLFRITCIYFCDVYDISLLSGCTGTIRYGRLDWHRSFAAITGAQGPICPVLASWPPISSKTTRSGDAISEQTQAEP